MQLVSFVVGPLATNCYLIWNEESLDGVLIDPGDEGDFLSEQILHRQINLKALLLTHAHFDHVLGLLPLKLNFPEARIYLHEQDDFLYERAEKSAAHWLPNLKLDPLPPVDTLFTDNSNLETLMGCQMIPTPGHTPGSVCYAFPDQSWLFSGDTLLKGETGRVTHRYSSPMNLSQSLAKLTQLKAETIVFPGHGETTIINQELR